MHAGTHPEGADLGRAMQKLEFLVASGVPEQDARIAMLTASHFTVGAVLEKQAAMQEGDDEDDGLGRRRAAAFDAGLKLIVDALARRAGHR